MLRKPAYSDALDYCLGVFGYQRSAECQHIIRRVSVRRTIGRGIKTFDIVALVVNLDFYRIACTGAFAQIVGILPTAAKQSVLALTTDQGTLAAAHNAVVARQSH